MRQGVQLILLMVHSEQKCKIKVYEHWTKLCAAEFLLVGLPFLSSGVKIGKFGAVNDQNNKKFCFMIVDMMPSSALQPVYRIEGCNRPTFYSYGFQWATLHVTQRGKFVLQSYFELLIMHMCLTELILQKID